MALCWRPHTSCPRRSDPFIQASLLSQSYNRYSYVLNNPLKLVDPSGYFFSFLKKIYKKVKKIVKKVAGIINDVVVKAVKFVKKYWRPIAAITVAVVASFALAAATGISATSIPALALGGGLGGFVQTGSLKGALIGAATAAVFGGIGKAFSNLGVNSGLVNTRCIGSINRTVVTGLNTAGRVAKALAHGAVGGLSSVARGGKFFNGFLSAGVTAGFSPTIQAKLPYDNQQIARIAAGGTLGGTTSVLAGGRFGDGFVTGAYSTWFNGEGATVGQRLGRFIDRMGESFSLLSGGFGGNVSFAFGAGARVKLGSFEAGFGAGYDTTGLGRDSLGGQYVSESGARWDFGASLHGYEYGHLSETPKHYYRDNALPPVQIGDDPGRIIGLDIRFGIVRPGVSYDLRYHDLAVDKFIEAVTDF